MVDTAQLSVPVALVTKIDAGRLLREGTAVHEFMEQAAIRQPGTALGIPKTSRLMADIVELNKLNMLRTEDREQLKDFIQQMLLHAPQLHMSFSAEPSPVFLQKLVGYIRENIHPLALLQVGLQPTIGAGFMMRTTNKYYDFSIRTTLKAKHDVLMHNIRATHVSIETTAVKEEVPA